MTRTERAAETDGRKSAEQTDLLRLLVEQVVDYAIFVLDPRGMVASWNAGAERIKGYRADEIIGHHFSRFYQEEAIRTGWPQSELEMAKQFGRFEDEGWRVRKDGSRFWANVVITALHDDAGTLHGFAKVTRDLTERKRAERLESDAEQLSQFVAMLAHELRNPLAPIRNAVTLARRELGNPQRLDWALSVVDRQSLQLTRLVDDLLDVTRIARGQIRLERRRIEIGEIVSAALETVAPLCAAKKVEIKVGAKADAIVRGDFVRLNQVLTNIMGNACKFSREGGSVEVAVSVDEERVTIAVRDNGIGIAPDLLPRIFDMFSQGDRSLDRSQGGLGLGLSIARRLVEMHGGSLTASSAGPGCGSEFVVSLPILERYALGDADLSSAVHRLTVLVVDDNVDAAESMQALLQHAGHRVRVAFDGAEGLRLARETIPDLILLDVGLPTMSGYDVARAVRATPALEGVQLVAVTGYGSDDDRRHALEAGFDLHVTKPIDLDVLQRNVPSLALGGTR